MELKPREEQWEYTNGSHDAGDSKQALADGPAHPTNIGIEEAALDGHAATDSLGRSTVIIDHQAERKLRTKMDMRLIPMVFILYLWTFIDRTNIGNARIAGLEADLGMKGYDYNIALTSFYVAYVVFEIPSNIVCKIIGPGRWIPILVFLFGILSMCTAFVKSFGGLIAMRFLIGALEGGMQPGLAFYLSRWYTRSELVFRIAWFIVAAPASGMFGGALAYGLLSINGIGWLTQWRQIFFVEGIVTAGIGAIGFFIMSDRPATASWLSPEEKALAISRVKRETPAQVEVTEKLRKKSFYSGLFSINAAFIALIFVFNGIAVQGISVFLPTLISSLYPGLTTLEKQAKTIPPYAVASVIVIVLPTISWRIGRRAIMMMLTAPLGIIGYALYLGSTNVTVRFIGTFFIMAGVYPFGAYCLAYGGANASPDSARGGAIALVSFGGNLGGLISTWTYLPTQAPNYAPGNIIGIVSTTAMTVLSGLVWAYQVRENKIRDRGGRDYRLEGLSEQEVAMLGHRHPKFRYTY